MDKKLGHEVEDRLQALEGEVESIKREWKSKTAYRHSKERLNR
jgi:hypothetical protein